ncbi:similar to Saccharomyces cerevisiae YCL045C EMC1 Member of a transmembrane complex required for efficient folding of proteins in the ER [Maudiozyma saulgeensis]|uniref:ER membrane protein complex subunit 1 n=1 Tax=Maudiozyma saulgeensis TaxID=1789683 RepID=A0A1X7R353_9SACH|nr:similar to Saccharomyces cerevisiae YCL045C EMC1 Member of a transmembrane complex required for efficient folding of proteins in the ER [Kazachstania saulgeensis]
MLYIGLLSALICSLCTFVNAVYRDEAFNVDWQLSTIGDYRCIVPDYANENQLIILSDHSQSETLVTYINETNGDVLLRYAVPFKMSDAMLVSDSHQLILKGDGDNNKKYSTIDLDTGLILEDSGKDLAQTSDFSFKTSCAASGYKIENIDQKTRLKLMDNTMGLPIFDVELPDTFTEVNYLSTDYSQILQFIVSNGDSHYTYFNYTDGGKNLTATWNRDESLVDIVDSAFCDLKDPYIDTIRKELAEEKNIDDVITAYIFRVKTNFNRIRKYLKKNQYSPGRVITAILKENELMGNINEEKAYKRDLKFGLAKLLIVATKNGRIAALHVSQQGNIMWNIRTGMSNIISIDYEPLTDELIVIDEKGSFIIFTSINEHMPPTLKKEGSFKLSTNSIITKAKKLDDSHNSYFVSLENGESQIVGVDNTQIVNTSNYFLTTHNEKEIRGHIVSEGNKLVNTWGITLNENEKLVAFASRSEDPVVNVGNVLGNRTVLYKYLYPNLVSYATINENDRNLYINLIDTITGELLHSQKHSNEKVDIDHPINLVFGENWFIYSYFSAEPIPEQRLTVVELYESLEANTKASDPNVDYNPLKGNINKPEVISRSYFFPEIIKDLKLTSTKFSITSKAIIIKLANEQITFIPKFVLNARSKEENNMSDDDKKEFMASPYISSIPINDNFIISHQRELIMSANSKLVSSPTNLESTSIICEIGKDVFCTRIYPSGQFDVMSPSFEKFQLFGTIFIVIVIVYYLRPTVANKKLKILWLIKD